MKTTNTPRRPKTRRSRTSPASKTAAVGRAAIDWASVRKELYRHEHIARGSRHEAIRRHAAEALALAKRLIRPRVTTARRKILARHDGVVIIDGIFLTGAALAAHLTGATDALIVLATLGEKLETEASRLMSAGESIEGYLLDKVGSLAVESLMENTERKIRREHARRGESIAMRFSPGYGGWPVEEQRHLDRLLDFSKAGVRLTASCMMAPKKSISAVLGIAPKGVFGASGISCTRCDMKDCTYRRARAGRR